MEKIEIASIAAFTLIECAAPRRNIKFFREGFFEDVSYLLIIIYAIPFIYGLIPWSVEDHLTYHLLDLSKANVYWQIFWCFLLTDLLRYLLHVSFHRFSWFWPFHKLHHSGKELSTLSGYRSSYWEDFFLLIFTIIPMSLLKFDVKVVEGVVLFFSVHGFFLHSNIRIRFPKYLRFIACPHFHHWHHAEELKFPYGQNNGVTLTIWDMILGTYYSDPAYPEAIGLNGGAKMEGNYISRYFYPLSWRKKKSNS